MLRSKEKARSYYQESRSRSFSLRMGKLNVLTSTTHCKSGEFPCAKNTYSFNDFTYYPRCTIHMCLNLQPSLWFNCTTPRNADRPWLTHVTSSASEERRRKREGASRTVTKWLKYFPGTRRDTFLPKRDGRQRQRTRPQSRTKRNRKTKKQASKYLEVTGALGY